MNADPTMYQYISDVVMKEMIKIKCPLPANEHESTKIHVGFTHEVCALRYAAGYVPRHLKKRVLKNKKTQHLALPSGSTR